MHNLEDKTFPLSKFGSVHVPVHPPKIKIVTSSRLTRLITVAEATVDNIVSIPLVHLINISCTLFG